MVSWIKVQVTLPESPKIFRLARLLGVGRMEALGYAVRWFCWLDTYCANGVTELHADEVDALLGRDGITAAFCELGWAAVDAAGYVLVLEFDKHNGESSKKRAEGQARVAAFRERQREEKGCNAKGVTGALQKALPEGEGEFIGNNEGAGIATLNGGSDGMPAPSPDGFAEWLAGLCAAHPSARRSRVLAADVLTAAREAWMRCPEAAEHAELLGAYFASKLQEDRRGVKFYRPTGQRKFFEHLEDVLAAAADRWARDAHWQPQQGQAVQRVVSIRKVDGKLASEEEKAAFTAFLRDGGKGEK